MTLVEFVPPTPHPLWELCPQMGITDVIVKVNPDLTGLPDPWRYETLAFLVARLKSAGLTVVGLEGDPFDMGPIKEFGKRGMGNGEREEALAHYRELLESMGRLGIKLLCYNFMVGKGWARTGVREGRGGAKATYFSLFTNDHCHNCSQITNTNHLANSENATRSTCSTRPNDLILTHEQVWANYEYFIKAVMPTAEKRGIRMGLHPDDPCLPSLGGYARIFGSIEAYDRAYGVYPSPSNAVTFCQANFKLMLGNEALADGARHFGKRIAFIHVRDVEGTKEDFTELFHDQGTIDQFALMRAYREIGLDVPVRGDHVPEMAYDRVLTPEGTPGYFTLGRLFANGYLKALLDGTAPCADRALPLPACSVVAARSQILKFSIPSKRVFHPAASFGILSTPMDKLEETDELKLDFTKLEKVGAQVATTRASGASSCDPGVIPVAVQNADTKEVILVAYTNEFAMKESFAKRKLVLWSTSRNKLWFKGETSGETFDLLEAYVNCEQNSLLYVVRPCRGGICHTKNAAGAPRNCYYRRIDFDTLKLSFVDSAGNETV